MTTVQRAAQILGWVFILVGVVGLIYSYTMEAGLLLGLFPVNVVHNGFHILLGLWGISSAKSFSSAKSYATIAGLLYVVLAVVGYLKPNPSDMLPLGGNDVWLHAVLGLLLLGIGLTARPKAVIA
jgi:hypothetical protein